MTITTYRITIGGRLSERFVSAIDGMRAEPAACGTVLVGDVVDQTQLYGLLNRLRDLGLELVRVERLSG
jgi:hypothetical protein